MPDPSTQLSHAARMNRRSAVGAIALMFLLIAIWTVCDEHTWRPAGRRLTPEDARLREEPPSRPIKTPPSP